MMVSRATIIRTAVLCAIGGLLVASVADAQSRRRLHRGLSPSERAASNRLVAMVDAVQGGELPGGDAWLKWSGHYLRALGGRTYTPFTVVIDDAPHGFDSVGLYVRAVRRASANPRRTVEAPIVRYPGITYGNPDERSYKAERDARQEDLAARRRRQSRPQRYDAVWFVETDSPADQEARLARGSLSLLPGEYDIYVAVRDFHADSAQPGDTRQASMVRRVTIPDLSGVEMSTSSIIVADRVEPLGQALSRGEQAERPYAFGSAELTPRVVHDFTPSEALSLMFFVYNLAASEAGKPDASIEYRFYKLGIDETLFVVTEPQEFSAETLPSDFSLASEYAQLPVSAEVPLSQFTPGLYRLQITLTDNLVPTSLVRDVEFWVTDTQTGE